MNKATRDDEDWKITTTTTATAIRWGLCRVHTERMHAVLAHMIPMASRPRVAASRGEPGRGVYLVVSQRPRLAEKEEGKKKEKKRGLRVPPDPQRKEH